MMKIKDEEFLLLGGCAIFSFVCMSFRVVDVIVGADDDDEARRVDAEALDDDDDPLQLVLSNGEVGRRRIDFYGSYCPFPI